MDAPTPLEPSTVEPPALTAEYHQARRNLNFASALLFAFEFIGIKPKEEFELDGFHFGLSSAGAMRWFLLLVVLFFAVRLWIEWVQCSVVRREHHAARLDFNLTFGVALVSVALFVSQRVIDAQVYRLIAEEPLKVLVWIVGMMLGLNFPLLAYAAVALRRLGYTNVRVRTLVASSFLAIVLCLVFVWPGSIRSAPVSSEFSEGVGAGVFCSVLVILLESRTVNSLLVRLWRATAEARTRGRSKS